MSRSALAFMLALCLVTLTGPLPGGIRAEARVRSKPEKMRTVALPGGEKISARIADTEKTRQTGLMGVHSLKPGEGMLFLFPDNGLHWMWMKNMKIPLDIVWLNDRKEIVEVTPNIPPCRAEPCPIYGPSETSRYVLELPAGNSKKYRLKKGDGVRFQP